MLLEMQFVRDAVTNPMARRLGCLSTPRLKVAIPSDVERQREYTRKLRIVPTKRSGNVVCFSPFASERYCAEHEDGRALRARAFLPISDVLPAYPWPLAKNTFIPALRAESIAAPFVIKGAINTEVFTA